MQIYNKFIVNLNFEHLTLNSFKNIKDNPLNSLNKTKTLFKLKQKSLELKLLKLKLGAVSFEIKQYFFGKVLFFENLVMIYKRQDNTNELSTILEKKLFPSKSDSGWVELISTFFIFLIFTSILTNVFYLEIIKIFPSFFSEIDDELFNFIKKQFNDIFLNKIVTFDNSLEPLSICYKNHCLLLTDLTVSYAIKLGIFS